MRLVSKLALAAVVLGALSTSASAAVNLSGSLPLSTNPGLGSGETLVWNFSSIQNSNFSYVGNVFTATVPNIAAEPAGLTGSFGAAEPASAGQAFTDATFSFTSPSLKLLSLSFDLGSLDTFNTLDFYSGSTLVRAFTGSQLTATPDGNQTSDLTNRRYYFTFGVADDINKVVFMSSQPAFEFANIGASWTSAVPEPATWAMMILGFGFVGFMMRSNRQKAILAV